MQCNVHLHLLLLHLLKAIVHAAKAFPLLQRNSSKVLKEEILLLSPFSSLTVKRCTNSNDVVCTMWMFLICRLFQPDPTLCV